MTSCQFSNISHGVIRSTNNRLSLPFSAPLHLLGTVQLAGLIRIKRVRFNKVRCIDYNCTDSIVVYWVK